MNSMQIKDKVRNIANKKNVDFNTVFRLYMYDRFIERLAVSEHKDNFIIKGGFYNERNQGKHWKIYRTI